MKRTTLLTSLAYLYLLNSYATAATLTILYSFSGSDGSGPYAALVQGSDGDFYGTTSSGGFGYGTVFRISQTGNFTNLYLFNGGADGSQPIAGLVEGSDGSFYGTTTTGGTNTCNCGTVFEISPTGGFASLHLFSVSDGAQTFAGLVQGSDGDFYGTTGGSVSNSGTVFRISPTGSLTKLHSFIGSDGADPVRGLVQGSDGDFYGTTVYGGSTNCLYGCGTVFRISSTGSFTNLYFFSGIDGEEPNAVLVEGSDGNFYGTTGYGGTGTNCKCGTVFKISPSGGFTNIYSFGSVTKGGRNPNGLVQGSDGNFYGTTQYGGVYGYGTVFRISPSGSFANLYSFSISDATEPVARLVQGSDGDFYGTSVLGGTNYIGSVFRFSVPLSPPPNQISGIRFSSTDVVISIPSVAGETYQLQYRETMSAGDWSNVAGASVTDSIGATLTLTNFGGALLPQLFYRFTITP